MDPFTHGLLGALAAQAVTNCPPATTAERRMGKSELRPTGVTVMAALFPDIDYLGFWFDPLRFLSDWHRGITHSLLVLPIWALLLGLLFSTLYGQRRHWRSYAGYCGLGLLSHISIDLSTAYGTQLFAPLSSGRYSFSLTYVVDPYFTAILLLPMLLLILQHYRKWLPARLKVIPPSRLARLGLVMLLPYLGLLVILQQEAKALGESMVQRQGLSGTRVDVLPQPLSPFNWKVIVSRADGYRVALVHLHGHPVVSTALPGPDWLHVLARSYGTADRLVWQPLPRPGQATENKSIQDVWTQPALQRFRHFARFPVLVGVDRNGQGECVWFTDLRYTLPAILPFFRFGMCREAGAAPWRLHRLRRFSDHERQAL